MSAKRYLPIAVFSATILFFVFWQTTAAKPPEKPGNPGMPGLLAEISRLQAIIDQQAALIEELEEMLSQLQNFAPVQQTGQTTCYDLDGNVIECAGTGQDGEFQKGVYWPYPRFIINGDDTVTDNLTGLIWLINANCISTIYPGFDNDKTVGDGKVTWQHALDFVAGINDGTFASCGVGYTDWRLAHVRELQSLIDYSRADADYPYEPALPAGHPFTNVQSFFNWSSTTYAGKTDNAWYVGMGNGLVYYVHNKSYDAYVWPVRGGYQD
jgi:hypothetical protein